MTLGTTKLMAITLTYFEYHSVNTYAVQNKSCHILRIKIHRSPIQFFDTYLE